MSSYNKQKFKQFKELYFQLLTRKNKEDNSHYNGIIQRYLYPVITAKHIPLEWRYDLNPETNPWLMERIGVNATMNSGANGTANTCWQYVWKGTTVSHSLPLPKVQTE